MQAFKVTCDNASNNGTMMDEFAMHMTKATGKVFDAKRNRIRYIL